MRLPLSRRATAGLVIAALLGAAGCRDDRDPSQSAAKAEPNAAAETTRPVRENVARIEFARGYSAGWKSGCDHAFRRSLAALVHDFQVDLSIEDCYALESADATAALPAEAPADPRAAGERRGETDGCRAASGALQRFGVVAWSQYDSIRESMCR